MTVTHSPSGAEVLLGGMLLFWSICEAARIAAPARLRILEHAVTKLIVARCERERRVRMETLDAVRIGNTCDIGVASAARAMRGLSTFKRSRKRRIIPGAIFERSDATSGFNAIDLAYEVRAREVEGSGEWMTVFVDFGLARDRGHAMRAVDSDPCQCPRWALDLGGHKVSVALIRRRRRTGVIVVVFLHGSEAVAARVDKESLIDTTSLDDVRMQWAEGDSRVHRFTDDSLKRQLLETLVEALLAELQKRAGQTFMLRDLVRIYRASDIWVERIVHERAAHHPWAWDSTLAGDAAFSRYARRAQDWKP